MALVEGLLHYFRQASAAQLGRDALDIALVYYLAYRALLVLRGTRALQITGGLAAIFLLYVVAQALRLTVVLSLVSTVISSALLIVVVVFQADIRRALMRVGPSAWFGSRKTQEARLIDEVVDAATELAKHRIGAIIAIEQDANLDEFVGANKGKDLDAIVSRELLVSLFIPDGTNKLHDGAVIIRNFRIAKAGVFFPMPDQSPLDQQFGSRHRAAYGITEETDAAVVVVSEERGIISFFSKGSHVPSLDGPKLRTALDGTLLPKLTGKRGKPSSAAARALPVRRPTERGEALLTPSSASERRGGEPSPAAPIRIVLPGRDDDAPPPSRRPIRALQELPEDGAELSEPPLPPRQPLRSLAQPEPEPSPAALPRLGTAQPLVAAEPRTITLTSATAVEPLLEPQRSPGDEPEAST